MTGPYWHPVLQARKLGTKPVRVMLEGQALVIFRTPDGLAAIADRCPHRSAPLSAGRVVDGTIECPYHGWRFNRAGRCIHVPLSDGRTPNCKVVAWTAREAHELIFVTSDPEAAGDILGPVWDNQPKVSRIVESSGHSTLADAVENVLDPIHTLFVHKGIIRGGGGPKNKVTFEAGIEAGDMVLRYSGEDQSSGLLSRLLEQRRSHAINRFSRPGVVSLEYWGETGLNFVLTLYFTQEDDMHLRSFAVMTGPRQGGLGWIKAALFVPIMRIVTGQDLRIMGKATSNWVAAGRPKHAIGPLDFLRPLITKVIDGETEDVAPQHLTLDL